MAETPKIQGAENTPVARTPRYSILPQDTTKNNPTVSQKVQNRKTAKFTLGAFLTFLLGLGFASRDGLTEGFKRIGLFGKAISSFFSMPATILTPFTIAYGEYEESRVKNPAEQSSSKLVQIVYPLLSSAFAPMTAFEPLEKATQSKGHMAATLVNMPHILFTFLSYTGGRFMTLLKSIKLATGRLSDDEKLKVENERKLFSLLGDIGSDNAAVTPQAHQAMTGWLTIFDLCRGNFSSVKERFSEAPVTTLLGTFIGSVFWLPTFVGKSFDTVIRTLEMSDQLKNAIPENSPIYKLAQKTKNWWHATSASGSLTGKILTSGREFGKIMQSVASPLGMISVVFPVFDHYRHGFNNEEAKDGPNSIRIIDKALNIGSFISHCYFTVLYGAFVRLPQSITTTAFYTCNLINKMRGIVDSPDDPRYLDPKKIRDRIFNPNTGWAKSISDFARNIIEKNTGKQSLYNNIYKVIADEECYRPLREDLYKTIYEGRYQYESTDKQTGQVITKVKEPNKEPSKELWGEVLKDHTKQILEGAEDRFKKYLKDASQFNDEQIDEFFNHHKIYDKIRAELEKSIDGEIGTCSENNETQVITPTKTNTPKFEKPKLESSSFFDMIKHPIKYWNDVKEVFKFRTALAQLVISPLNVLDFVNIVEMGDKNQPYWLNNWLVQESSIRIGDYQAGNIGELMTVYNHAVQTSGKGISKIAQGFQTLFGLAA